MGVQLAKTIVSILLYKYMYTLLPLMFGSWPGAAKLSRLLRSSFDSSGSRGTVPVNKKFTFDDRSTVQAFSRLSKNS